MALQIIQVSTSNRQLRDWDPQETVIIEAADNETFTVHKDLACFYSPVFKTAFNSQFIEGQIQRYTLEDVHPSVVRLLIQWFYNQKLVIEFTRASKSRTDQGLVELWVLADKLIIPALQNCVIRALEKMRIMCRTISTSCLNYVFENTERASPLRILFLKWCAFSMAVSRFDERPEHFPTEMLLDLVSMLSYAVPEAVMTTRAEEARDMSNYELREHNDDERE